ncbi:MAG: hypothetical protein HQK54_07840 [Oligoflexales bacterium]|nr:hypothetical protein [Oligoflexales bacterium]
MINNFRFDGKTWLLKFIAVIPFIFSILLFTVGLQAKSFEFGFFPSSDTDSFMMGEYRNIPINEPCIESGHGRCVPAGPRRFKIIDYERAWLVVPGFYQNFTENSIGGELSVIKGAFGGVIGFEEKNISYLEAEVVLGPLAVGLGPRWFKGHVGPQITLSVPIFFFFPYWRWYNEESSVNGKTREFGIMLKIPLTFGAEQVFFDKDSPGGDLI